MKLGTWGHIARLGSFCVLASTETISENKNSRTEFNVCILKNWEKILISTMKSAYFFKWQDFKYMETEILYSRMFIKMHKTKRVFWVTESSVVGNCLIILFHKLIKHILRVLYLKFYMWNFKTSLIENQNWFDLAA